MPKLYILAATEDRLARMTATELQTRNKSGESWPARRLQAPPVFVWPPRPIGFLRWLFGNPGYLLPWNIIYAVIAASTWLLLIPDLSRMHSLQVGWVALLFLQNLALICLVVGAWHFRLYIQKAQALRFKYNVRGLATNNSTFLFRHQTLDNIFWTMLSAVPIWTGYEVVTLWGQANGILPVVNWKIHPVYCVLLMCLIPLFREVHFYLVHRLIHCAPLYRMVHSLHHKNVNPGPWSGLAMHPIEHLLYFSGVLLHWIVPSHPLHVVYHMQLSAFTPSQGHCGFERLELTDHVTVDTGNFMHYLHHKYFVVNYGGDGLVPFDQWFGTFHDGSEAAQEAMEKSGRRVC